MPDGGKMGASPKELLKLGYAMAMRDVGLMYQAVLESQAGGGEAKAFEGKETPEEEMLEGHEAEPKGGDDDAEEVTAPKSFKPEGKPKERLAYINKSEEKTLNKTRGTDKPKEGPKGVPSFAPESMSYGDEGGSVGVSGPDSAFTATDDGGSTYTFDGGGDNGGSEVTDSGGVRVYPGNQDLPADLLDSVITSPNIRGGKDGPTIEREGTATGSADSALTVISKFLRGTELTDEDTDDLVMDLLLSALGTAGGGGLGLITKGAQALGLEGKPSSVNEVGDNGAQQDGGGFTGPVQVAELVQSVLQPQREIPRSPMREISGVAIGPGYGGDDTINPAALRAVLRSIGRPYPSQRTLG